MEQLTRDQAIAFYDSELWRGMSDRDIAEFQMRQQFLAVPFDVLHRAVGETLGRPVFSHEFGSKGAEQIKKELFEGASPATFEDIVELIPEEKRVILVAP